MKSQVSSSYCVVLYFWRCCRGNLKSNLNSLLLHPIFFVLHIHRIRTYLLGMFCYFRNRMSEIIYISALTKSGVQNVRRKTLKGNRICLCAMDRVRPRICLSLGFASRPSSFYEDTIIGLGYIIQTEPCAKCLRTDMLSHETRNASHACSAGYTH